METEKQAPVEDNPLAESSSSEEETEE